MGLGLQDGPGHGLAPGVIHHGKSFFVGGGGQIPLIVHLPDGEDPGENGGAPAAEDLQAKTSGHAQRGREPPGKGPAAGLYAAILHIGGIVGVARPGDGSQGLIIIRFNIGIFDNRRDVLPGGYTVLYAGEKPGNIRLPAGCDEGAAARGAAA